jgi:hypothetical protein
MVATTAECVGNGGVPRPLPQEGLKKDWSATTYVQPIAFVINAGVES